MAALLTGLQHPKWKVRRTCADFMDHWGDQRCVEPLLRALQDPKENVRRLALHSISCQQCKVTPLRGDFVPALIQLATTDRSTRTRRIATGTLGNYLHDERAIATLHLLLEKDRDSVVASRAREALDRRNTLVQTQESPSCSRA
jgi:HEAT repeat protein